MFINLDPKDILDLTGTIIVAGALVVSIVTFYVTFKRGKKAEQMKIAHDIMRDFSEAEDKILNTSHESNKWKLRHLQYLNVSEWLSFLVNHGEITNKNIIDYFKPLLVEDYHEVFGLPELESERNNPEDFKEFKELYKKWSKNH